MRPSEYVNNLGEVLNYLVVYVLFYKKTITVIQS